MAAVLTGTAATAMADIAATAPEAVATPQVSHDAQQPDLTMTAASRRQLIDKLIGELNDSYVFPDMAKKIDTVLRERLKRGDYDKIVGARRLSEVLTQHLQTISSDRHLRVSYVPVPIPERQPKAAPSAQETADRLAMMRSNNFGVAKVERLPWNIGYLKLDGFAAARAAAETLAAAMTVLAHTEALIIDLRDNHGGDAGAVTLLASYLFDGRTRLNDFYYRAGNRTEQRWSAEAVPGLRYGQGRDVIVLTSRETFSAAEDFAYALQNLKRATVIGERSGGGAHPGDDRRLLPHFSVFVPLGRSISPITQTNWEGGGVTPDVSVCAGDALRTAQVRILEKMARAEQDGGTLAGIRERIAALGPAPGGATLVQPSCLQK